MDLLDEFRKSETLRVSVSGEYGVKPALAPDGSFRVRERHVPKARGLGWVLTPKEVGLPDLPVALELRGESVGVDADGRPLIRFTVDQDLGVRVPRRPLVVERAWGAITVALSPASAASAGAPAGDRAGVAAATLETIGGDNGFSVEIRATVLGFKRRVTVHVTNLKLQATAFKPQEPR